MTPAEEIKQFLDDHHSKVSAATHWINQMLERGDMDSEYLKDGPYPPMEKLIALCRVLINCIEQVDKVSADPKFVGVFQIAAIKGMHYTGPKFNTHWALTRAAEIVSGK